VKVVDLLIRFAQLCVCLLMCLFGPIGIFFAVICALHVIFKKGTGWSATFEPLRPLYNCNDCNKDFCVDISDQYTRKTCDYCGSHDTVKATDRFW